MRWPTCGETYSGSLRNVLVANAGVPSRFNLAEITEHGHDRIIAAASARCPSTCTSGSVAWTAHQRWHPEETRPGSTVTATGINPL